MKYLDQDLITKPISNLEKNLKNVLKEKDLDLMKLAKASFELILMDAKRYFFVMNELPKEKLKSIYANLSLNLINPEYVCLEVIFSKLRYEINPNYEGNYLADKMLLLEKIDSARFYEFWVILKIFSCSIGAFGEFDERGVLSECIASRYKNNKLCEELKINPFVVYAIQKSYQNCDYEKFDFSAMKEIAELGYPVAQNCLGSIYQKRIKCTAEQNLAFHYYNIAAKKGNLSAIANLAYCYENEIGAEKDLVKAIYYYSILITYKQSFIYDTVLELVKTEANYEIAKKVVLEEALVNVGKQDDLSAQSKLIISYLTKKYISFIAYNGREVVGVNSELWVNLILPIIEDIYITINKDFLAESLNKKGLSLDVADGVAGYWMNQIKAERKENPDIKQGNSPLEHILPISKAKNYKHTKELFSIGK